MSEPGKKTPPSELIKAEIPIVEKIIRDETWYEGERRGAFVDPNDPTVQSKVVEVVEKCADKIRDEAIKKIGSDEKVKPQSDPVRDARSNEDPPA